MTLYLHVGAHKTGTTTIQQFAAARRGVLRERGLHYPDFGDIGYRRTAGHHPFAHAVAGWATKPDFTPHHVTAFADLCARLGTRRNVLVSAEPIFRHVMGQGDFWARHTAYVEHLARVLARVGSITPVVVLRRQDTFAASMWQEHIKTMTVTYGLDRFVAARADFMDFERHVRLYEQAFGPPKVLIYEELAAGDQLLRNFFSELGVELSQAEASHGAANPSLHPAVILYKLRRNEAGLSAADNKELKRILQRVSRDLYTGTKAGLFSAAELDNAFAVFSASNERLASRLGRGEGEAVFPARGPLPPIYGPLDDAQYQRIDAAVAQYLAAPRKRRGGASMAPRSSVRRLLAKLGLGKK